MLSIFSCMCTINYNMNNNKLDDRTTSVDYTLFLVFHVDF